MTSVFVDQPRLHGSVKNIVFVNSLVKTLLQQIPCISNKHLSPYTCFFSLNIVLSVFQFYIYVENQSVLFLKTAFKGIPKLKTDFEPPKRMNILIYKAFSQNNFEFFV